jgi:phosphatidylserine synthase
MIGHAMLYAVLVGMPILAAATIGARFLRRHGRAERWVCVAALGLAFAAPVAMLSRRPTPQFSWAATPARS